MDVQIRLDAEHVVTVPIPQAKAWAEQLEDAATRAERSGHGDVVHLSVESLGWAAQMTAAEAKHTAREIERLAVEMEQYEEELRRAAGYSPASEEITVVHNPQGEIVGMTKRLRY
jgi:hypothetical protein